MNLSNESIYYEVYKYRTDQFWSRRKEAPSCCRKNFIYWLSFFLLNNCTYGEGSGEGSGSYFCPCVGWKEVNGGQRLTSDEAKLQLLLSTVQAVMSLIIDAL
jgi:hypothetical protein